MFTSRLAYFRGQKSGKLRLVIDARQSNCWFKPPAHVDFCTGSNFSGLGLEQGQAFYFGHFDVCDAFYNFSLPAELRRYFGCPPVLAGDVGVTSLGGLPVRPDFVLTPRLRILPMGWSHALWFCQTLHLKLLSRVPGFIDDRLLWDRRSQPSFSPWGFIVYVVNCIIMGHDPVAVAAAVEEGRAAVEAAGLLTHGVERGDTTAELLGWALDVLQGTIRPKAERVWRLKLAIDYLVAQRIVDPPDVEKVLGHCAFLALIARPALSCFRAAYTFTGRFRGEETRALWSSVRRELCCFRGLLPLIFFDLRLLWDPLVHCTDASPSGVGCVTKQFDTGLVRRAGRINERWRFSRHRESCAPRLDAAASASRFSLPKEIAAPGWSIILSAKWSDPPKHLVEGEGRGLMFAVKHSLRSGSSFGKRHLLLSDSLTNVLAFGKGRSSRDGVATSARAFAAHSLATGARFYLRRLPSEANHADGLSRGRPIDTCPSAWSGAAAEPEMATGRRDLSPPVPATRCSLPGCDARDSEVLHGYSVPASMRQPSPSPNCGPGWHTACSARPPGSKPGSAFEAAARPSRPPGAAGGPLFLGGEVGAASDSGALSQSGAGFLPLGNAEQFGDREGAGLGRRSDCVDGRAVLGGRGCAPPLYSPGRAALHSRGPREAWRSGLATGPSGLEGLAAPGAGPVKAAAPLGARVRSGDGARVPGHAVGGSARRLHHDLLPAAKRVLPFERAKPRGTDAGGWPSHAHWSVILHEFIGEDSQPSKTGEFDESLLLDLPEHEYLSGVLREWRRDTAPDERFVPFAQSHLACAFRLSGMLLGLDPPPKLYQLRHSGPSADFAGGRRSLDSIKRRGRWRTDASVRRYETRREAT